MHPASGMIGERAPRERWQHDSFDLVETDQTVKGLRNQRRRHALDAMQGRALSERQYLAGCAIRDAAERTEMGGVAPFAQQRVDTSPDRDAQVVRALDLGFRLAAYLAVVPRPARRVVDHVCIRGHAIHRFAGGAAKARALEHLCEALDRVADVLGLPPGRR